jgi:hypothetical protein
LYGISKNPDTDDYILVQKYPTWISGNEKIDDFIQEMQLKVIGYNDVVLEWIPYNQFNRIKKIGKNGSISVYSAIWKSGPLHWSKQDEEYTKDSNKGVFLKCLCNSQNSIEFVIDEV